MNRRLLAWEAGLTFYTTVTAGIGLIGLVPVKLVGLMVLVSQGLTQATIFYKLGQVNNQPPQPSPLTVNVHPGTTVETPSV